MRGTGGTRDPLLGCPFLAEVLARGRARLRGRAARLRLGQGLGQSCRPAGTGLSGVGACGRGRTENGEAAGRAAAAGAALVGPSPSGCSGPSPGTGGDSGLRPVRGAAGESAGNARGAAWLERVG